MADYKFEQSFLPKFSSFTATATVLFSSKYSNIKYTSKIKQKKKPTKLSVNKAKNFLISEKKKHLRCLLMLKIFLHG